MLKVRKNFLARERNDELLRDITALYMPKVGGGDGFYKLEKSGHVVVKARKKSSAAKRGKLRKMINGHGQTDAYLDTVRILAGRNKTII